MATRANATVESDAFRNRWGRPWDEPTTNVGALLPEFLP